MKNEIIYREPMQPWPDLALYVKKIHLEQMNLALFIYQAGDINNPTIIMIHGLGDEADTWRYMIQPLSENYHVIALDLPGFGRSQKPKLDYTPKFMIESILQLMTFLNIKEAILIGSSLGAMLAHAISIWQPKKVLGLILVGGSLLQVNGIKDKSLKIMSLPLIGEWFYTRLRKNPNAAYESLGNVYHNLAKLPEIDRDFLYQRVNERVWSDDQRRAYFSTLRNLTPWLKPLQNKLPDLLASLDIPTLIVRGEFDALFPFENAQAVARVQPRASIVTLAKSGHLPHQETPEQFLSAITEWLQTNA